jgi:hypothetical protein
MRDMEPFCSEPRTWIVFHAGTIGRTFIRDTEHFYSEERTWIVVQSGTKKVVRFLRDMDHFYL